MGPEATADFFSKLVRCTPAEKDSDHVRIIVDCNPQIPDRSAYLTCDGPNPVPELVATARNLEKAGANLLTIPCITAHAYIDPMRDVIKTTILSALEVTARHVDEEYGPDVPLAIISSSGTLKMKLFQRAMPEREFIRPTRAEQDEIVTPAIYGPRGVKTAGVCAQTLEKMTDYVSALGDAGARGVIAGCTEFSALFNGAPTPVPIIDPMVLLAEEAVRLATAHKDGKTE